MSGFDKGYDPIEKKLTDEELLQVIRINIAGELEAIYLYDEHIRATNNQLAKKVLSSIRDEEKIHVGELIALLNELGDNEDTFIEKGFQEVSEMMKDMGKFYE